MSAFEKMDKASFERRAAELEKESNALRLAWVSSLIEAARLMQDDEWGKEA